MKTIVRALALAIFAAGASAAVVTSHAPNALAFSHQVAIAANPIPACTPGVPCTPPKGGLVAIAANPIPACTPGVPCTPPKN